MNRYTHLFFDLDHTLWDFDKNSETTLHQLYLEAELEKLGAEPFAQFTVVYHQINDKLWDRFRKGFLSREDLRWKRMWQTLVHYKINNEKLAKEMSERYLEILPTQTNIFPHCKEMLQYCVDKNYSMHLITNGFEQTQKLKLRHAGIDTYFETMITSEQAMSMKPNKEIFEFALQHTRAKVSQSLMIGDALDVDILGAKNVGMDQVYFNPHQIPHTQHPTYEIHTLQNMFSIV
jgi:putative hydrolase of the HAD superfamily